MTEARPESECLRGKVAAVTAPPADGRATPSPSPVRARTSSVSISVRRWTRVPVWNHRPRRFGGNRRLVRAAGRRWLASSSTSATCLHCEQPRQRRTGIRGIDILFANAGVQSFHPLLEMEDADWHITIDVNLTARRTPFGPSRLICEARGGRIILTSSTQGSMVRNTGILLGVEMGNYRVDEVSGAGTWTL